MNLNYGQLQSFILEMLNGKRFVCEETESLKSSKPNKCSSCTCRPSSLLILLYNLCFLHENNDNTKGCLLKLELYNWTNTPNNHFEMGITCVHFQGQSEWESSSTSRLCSQISTPGFLNVNRLRWKQVQGLDSVSSGLSTHQYILHLDWSVRS